MRWYTAVFALALAVPASAQVEAKALVAAEMTDAISFEALDVGGQLQVTAKSLFVGVSSVFGIANSGKVLSHRQHSVEVGTHLGPVGAFGFIGQREQDDDVGAGWRGWNTLGVGGRFGALGIFLEGRVNLVAAVDDDGMDMGRDRSFELRALLF